MVFETLTLDAVNRAAATFDGAAGKSLNVAKVLQTLGEQPLATGFLGGDRGEFVGKILAELGIEEEFVVARAPTRQCVTVIDKSSGAVTELVEESHPVDAAELARLMEVVNRRVPHCRAVVMSGTIAPGVPLDLYGQITRLAKTQGVLSVVDAQGQALAHALEAGPGLVKPNRLELAATVGRALPDEAAVVGAIKELHERGAGRVVVTAGKDPTLASDGTQIWRITGPEITSVNPIGSGDALAAGLVWRLVQGEDLGQACRWGAAVGAANALSWMAGDVKPEEVDRLAASVTV
ncbi:MAG TPA: 1-phosphofructokinase family hexose kinase, partial [Verrucomicrobiae bacterium]|nr:1-phosphofructokinase family hexose kinase [Verrucomicrobiae bacterium]